MDQLTFLALNNEVQKELESFLQLLSSEPLPSEIAAHPYIKGYMYVPISFIESSLDELFFGLWQTKEFRWNVVMNEIVGSISLGVFHPVAGQWIWREGSASIVIQQESAKRGGSGKIENLSREKIANTLGKDFPHLKASCISNAARSFGKLFGRDLNRKLEDEYHQITEQQESHEQAIEILNKCESIQGMNKAWAMNPQWHKVPAVHKVYKKKAEQLQKAASNGR